MKTDDFIAALAADTPGNQTRPRLALAAAVLGGAIIAFSVFMLTLGPRPDFMSAMHTLRFVFKFVVTLTLAASAFMVARDAMRPETSMRKGWMLLIAPALMIAAVILELFAIPHSAWMPKLMGHNMRFCTTMIPVFAVGPLALLLWAFRRGAPAHPARAGALAGLLAGGLGAAFYAAHCFDDSPLFVATWYTLAIGAVAALGALLGSRLLRW